MINDFTQCTPEWHSYQQSEARECGLWRQIEDNPKDLRGYDLSDVDNWNTITEETIHLYCRRCGNLKTDCTCEVTQ